MNSPENMQFWQIAQPDDTNLQIPTCLRHIHTLHLQITTYLHYPYIHALQLQPTLLYNHYNTTRPMIYALPLHTCSMSMWLPVRLLFASDRILCAATYIGDPIVFENV